MTRTMLNIKFSVVPMFLIKFQNNNIAKNWIFLASRRISDCSLAKAITSAFNITRSSWTCMSWSAGQNVRTWEKLCDIKSLFLQSPMNNVTSGDFRYLNTWDRRTSPIWWWQPDQWTARCNLYCMEIQAAVRWPVLDLCQMSRLQYYRCNPFSSWASLLLLQ